MCKLSRTLFRSTTLWRMSLTSFFLRQTQLQLVQSKKKEKKKTYSRRTNQSGFVNTSSAVIDVTITWAETKILKEKTEKATELNILNIKEKYSVPSFQSIKLSVRKVKTFERTTLTCNKKFLCPAVAVPCAPIISLISSLWRTGILQSVTPPSSAFCSQEAMASSVTAISK